WVRLELVQVGLVLVEELRDLRLVTFGRLQSCGLRDLSLDDSGERVDERADLRRGGIAAPERGELLADWHERRSCSITKRVGLLDELRFRQRLRGRGEAAPRCNDPARDDQSDDHHSTTDHAASPSFCTAKVLRRAYAL